MASDQWLWANKHQSVASLAAHFQRSGGAIKARLTHLQDPSHSAFARLHNCEPSPKRLLTNLDTRVAGTNKVVERPPLTRQLREFLSFEKRPWQKKMDQLVAQEGDRSIIIYDRIGNIGKSIYVEYLEYQGLACQVPAFRFLRDLMKFCLSFDAQKCYIIDMPVAMKKAKLDDLYTGLETLKDGFLWDKRSGKTRYIDRPQVIVFTNTLPKWGRMNRDKWVVYETQPDFDMIEVC